MAPTKIAPISRADCVGECRTNGEEQRPIGNSDSFAYKGEAD